MVIPAKYKKDKVQVKTEEPPATESESATNSSMSNKSELLLFQFFSH